MSAVLDRAQGRALKEKGQQLAHEHSGPWRDEVVDLFKAWAAKHKPNAVRSEFTIEQFRATLTPAQQPISHKAWGSLPRGLVSLGLIEAVLHDDGTPVQQPAASVDTRAHYVRVWRFL